jgi:MoxR-like ATPase
VKESDVRKKFPHYDHISELLFKDYFLIKDNENIYMEKIYEIESNVLSYITHLIGTNQPFYRTSGPRLDQNMYDCKTLTEEQKNAIEGALHYRVSIITGGAGTGKTYSAVEIAKLIGWKSIEVNCNQFTSPLDLLGGQTISGYQEGAVVQAWKNEIQGQKVDGVVLILDELPKIDPNTAGILNSALAKIKLSADRSQITNGRGEKFEKKNVFIIATGNVRLNETSEDYEANFKQDLSLQDRFAGSTYPIFV